MKYLHFIISKAASCKKKLLEYSTSEKEKLRQKKRRRKLEAMTQLYQKIKHHEHVFIYSVCGRASSTALQRIVNSSHEVCIFGESRGTTNLLLETINSIHELRHNSAWEKAKGNQFSTFTDSFLKRKHNAFYPNAFRELDDLELLHLASFTDLIRPLGNISRVGYKEIMLESINTLTTLKRIFPQCKLLFIYRNPVDQWNSIKYKGWWNYSSSVDEFLSQYQAISDILLSFMMEHSNWHCIENSQLYDAYTVQSLLAKLNISTFDKSLISDNVNKTMEQVVTDQEIEIITQSKAFANYHRLRELSFTPGQ